MTLTRPGAAQTPAGGRPKVASKPSTARRDEAVRAASSASAYQSALVLGGASVMTRPRAVGRRFAPAPDLAASSRRHIPQSGGDSLRLLTWPRRHDAPSLSRSAIRSGEASLI